MHPQDQPEDKQPTLARRSPFAPARKLCPKCLNPLESGNPNAGPYIPLGGFSGIVPTRYACPKCGYSGTVFLEQEKPTEKGKS